MKPYPLLLEPILKEKVWGGRRLASLGRVFPPDVRIGESWEVADLGVTDAEGGGGGEARTLIATGEMAGLSLGEASRAQGANLLGRCRLSEEGGFPILMKYLDAEEHLSVQVHPSESFAAAHPEARIKTETWVVIEADPGAVIFAGLKEPKTTAELRAHAENGTLADVLHRLVVRPGDCVHLPSGTIHALGAGVLVAEVQTPSDTTYRLFDWGRKGRRLEVERALQCAVTDRFSIAAVRSNGSPRSRLVSTKAYELYQLKAYGGDEAPIAMSGEGPLIWMCLDGAGSIESDTGSFAPVAFERGTTVVLPAALEGARCVVDRAVSILETRLMPT